MLTSEIILNYLDQVWEGLKNDASAKSQKFPVNSSRKEVTETRGTLYGAAHIKYLVTGRGPGKQPPPEKMLKFVQDNPQILEEARQRFKYINEKGLAYLIGRKIARQGTDIFTGKKQGIDLEGSINTPMDSMLRRLAYHEALKVSGQIKQAAAA